MKTPALQIVITPAGVQEVEILYHSDQREAAWKLCQEYLTRLLLDGREKASAAMMTPPSEPVEPSFDCTDYQEKGKT